MRNLQGFTVVMVSFSEILYTFVVDLQGFEQIKREIIQYEGLAAI